VLVTGTSGHLGGVIGAHLHEQGHEVVGVSRRLNSSARTVSRAISLDLASAGAAEAIAAAAAPCDAIVHAAAAIDRDPLAPAITLTNGLGTQQLLALATRWKVEGFVFLSSVPVIGRPVELPITESHPVCPASAYHASKLYGEQLVRLGTTTGVSLRLTAPVGPGMDERRILPVFVRRALRGQPLEVAGEGSRGQDYVDARDVASAVEAALERRATGVLNVASGRCITNLELARLCLEVIDSNSTVRLSGEPDPEEGVRWEVSTARAERQIGYRPAHPLEDSIAALADALGSEAADD
jgi:nucleoside-diphosphate-sugar epimerase